MIQTVAGVDGCRGGWVVATARAGRGRLSVRISRARTIRELVGENDVAAIAIDIPIGLTSEVARAGDIDTRRLLHQRRSSVFPAPIRQVLDCETWEDANAVSRAATGKGMSRQAFGIVDKVREVDQAMTPALQERVVEAHPELAFTMLAGAPMTHHKATAGGRAERIDALRVAIANLDEVVATRLAGARPDDVLDAAVLAWSARRYLSGTNVRVGDGVRDSRGLRMEIIA